MAEELPFSQHLQLLQGLEVLGPPAPPHVGALAQHSRAAARRVQQHAVKPLALRRTSTHTQQARNVANAGGALRDRRRSCPPAPPRNVAQAYVRARTWAAASAAQAARSAACSCSMLGGTPWVAARLASALVRGRLTSTAVMLPCTRTHAHAQRAPPLALRRDKRRCTGGSAEDEDIVLAGVPARRLRTCRPMRAAANMVLPPGAAQQSSTRSPGCGRSASATTSPDDTSWTVHLPSATCPCACRTATAQAHSQLEIQQTSGTQARSARSSCRELQRLMAPVAQRGHSVAVAPTTLGSGAPWQAASAGPS